MQISMHNWMRAEPIEVTIARLARCGYDAIEISGEHERYDTKHVRKLLQDHKLTCWGSVTLMLADRDLLAKDEAQRAASVKCHLWSPIEGLSRARRRAGSPRSARIRRPRPARRADIAPRPRSAPTRPRPGGRQRRG